MSLEAPNLSNKAALLNKDALAILLRENATIFEYDYGTKQVNLSWDQRRKKIIKSTDQLKPFANYHIITGEGNILDLDLDCKETRALAEYFMPPTQMKYGRESTPASHWIYKVLDLNKKHTRKFFMFEDEDVTKKTLVELRGYDHYSMCSGKYPENEHVEWNEYTAIGETTYDTLYKATAMLSAAAVILRNYPAAERNVYVWYVAATLWHHKVDQNDTERLIEVVCRLARDEEVKGRLAKVKAVYKNEDPNKEIVGLPTLKKHLKWNDKQTDNFKDILFAITGRSELPKFTHEFVDRIAYMMKQKKYYDLEDKEMYDAEAIDVKYAKFFRDAKYTPLLFWKKHPDSKVCVDFTYKPNDQKRFVHVNKKLMINVYEKNELQPNKKADTDIFYALLKHIIPHEKERNYFLDWYSFPIQNPGIKIRNAIIMQSDEFQLGKGSLFDLHRDILGHNNTRKIELAEALDKGKNYLLNYQTVLVDEAKSSGSWSEKAQLINTLKTIITEGSIGVRQLYKEYTEQDTCTNYWINTNYRDAFPLPKNEVRYWVYFSDAKRNEQMLDEFHNQRLSGDLPAGVLADLLDRDLSKFNPLAPAPWTQYRDEMSNMADRPLNDYVKQQFDQGAYPFDRDMLTTLELFDWLKREARMKVSREREVANALALIGGKCVKQVPISQVGSRATLWIIRNHKKHGSKTARELGGDYLPFFSDVRVKVTNRISDKEDKKSENY
ncbi:hypothetical protein OA107_00995 [Candidatus Pelagibacter sp.]|nr:hypothetical protein [Candidatus Pelagibacter sp.]